MTPATKAAVIRRWLRPARTFLLVWQALAVDGLCDAPGSAQYRRVYLEWLQAGRPRPLHLFIAAHANAGPPGPLSA